MDKLIRYAKVLALLSFLIGSAIMLAYVFIPYTREIMFVGMVFTCGAFMLNVLMVLTLLVSLIWYESFWREVLKTIGLLLVNLPVAMLYICFVGCLMNIVRVRLINDRGVAITDLKIEGCEAKKIARLEPGESVTEWIDIKGDCDIHLRYELNGVPQYDIVESYLCGGNGKAKRYHIDGKYHDEE